MSTNNRTTRNGDSDNNDTQNFCPVCNQTNCVCRSSDLDVHLVDVNNNPNDGLLVEYCLNDGTRLVRELSGIERYLTENNRDVVSGVYNDDMIILTRTDGSTVNIDLCALKKDIFNEFKAIDKHLVNAKLNSDTLVLTVQEGPITKTKMVDLSRFSRDVFTTRVDYLGDLVYRFIRNDGNTYDLNLNAIREDLLESDDFITEANYNEDNGTIEYTTSNGHVVENTDLNPILDRIDEIRDLLDRQDVFVEDVVFEGNNYNLRTFRNDNAIINTSLEYIRQEISEAQSSDDFLTAGSFNSGNYNLSLTKRFSGTVNISLRPILDDINALTDLIEEARQNDDYVSGGNLDPENRRIVLSRAIRDDINIDLSDIFDRLELAESNTDNYIIDVTQNEYNIQLIRNNDLPPLNIDLSFIGDRFDVVNNRLEEIDQCLIEIKDGDFNDGVLESIMYNNDYTFSFIRSNGLEPIILDLGFIENELDVINELRDKIDQNCSDIEDITNGVYNDGVLSNIVRNEDYDHDFIVTNPDGSTSEYKLDLGYISEDINELEELINSGNDNRITDLTEFDSNTYNINVSMIDTNTNFTIDLSVIRGDINDLSDRIDTIEGNYMTEEDEKYILDTSFFDSDSYEIIVNVQNDNPFAISLSGIRDDIEEVRTEFSDIPDNRLTAIMPRPGDRFVYDFFVSGISDPIPLNISNSTIQLTNTAVNEQTYFTEFFFESEYTHTTPEFSKIRPTIYTSMDFSDKDLINDARDGDFYIDYNFDTSLKDIFVDDVIINSDNNTITFVRSDGTTITRNLPS